MSDVFYLRQIDPPMAPADMDAMMEHAAGCFDIHHVTWRKSYLSAAGDLMLCWYQGRDAESVRYALRTLGADIGGVHQGSVVDPDDSTDESNVVVQLDYQPGAESETLEQLRSSLGSVGKVMQCMTFSRACVMVLALQAESIEAVRAALEKAGVAPASIWPCQVLSP